MISKKLREATAPFLTGDTELKEEQYIAWVVEQLASKRQLLDECAMLYSIKTLLSSALDEYSRGSNGAPALDALKKATEIWDGFHYKEAQ